MAEKRPEIACMDYVGGKSRRISSTWESERPQNAMINQPIQLPLLLTWNEMSKEVILSGIKLSLP